MYHLVIFARKRFGYGKPQVRKHRLQVEHQRRARGAGVYYSLVRYSCICCRTRHEQHAAYSIQNNCCRLHRAEPTCVPLAAEDVPPAVDESAPAPVSTATPVTIAEVRLEISSDHRASLGGLGADTTWGDSRSSGATTSRCVAIALLHLFTSGCRAAD